MDYGILIRKLKCKYIIPRKRPKYIPKLIWFAIVNWVLEQHSFIEYGLTPYKNNVNVSVSNIKFY